MKPCRYGVRKIILILGLPIRYLNDDKSLGFVSCWIHSGKDRAVFDDECGQPSVARPMTAGAHTLALDALGKYSGPKLACQTCAGSGFRMPARSSQNPYPIIEHYNYPQFSLHAYCRGAPNTRPI